MQIFGRRQATNRDEMVTFMELFLGAYVLVHLRLIWSMFGPGGSLGRAFDKYRHDGGAATSGDRLVASAGAVYYAKSHLVLLVLCLQVYLGFDVRAALTLGFTAYAVFMNALLPGGPTRATLVYALGALGLCVELWLLRGPHPLTVSEAERQARPLWDLAGGAAGAAASGDL